MTGDELHPRRRFSRRVDNYARYRPLPVHPDHPAFLQALQELFAAHEQQGRTRFPYLTQLYCGRIR